ncbi:MAG TPA: hypothetical protein VNG13_12285 [Mycobacteriales bacterium]|nr:hypothetical protein [Mycobacteriales bacterium]
MTAVSGTGTGTAPAPRPEPARPPAGDRAAGTELELTLAEVVVVGLTIAVAVFAWMSLLLLDNHVGRLGWVSLTTVGALGLLFAIAALGGRRPRIRLDAGGLVVVAFVGLVAGVFFFPGFDYGATDKDPGAYVAIGAAFAHHASYSFPDTLARHVPGLVVQTIGTRFPAIFIQPHNLVVPQFYHLWPALLAMANDVHGLGLEVQVAPFIGVLAACTFVLLLRRAVPGRASLPTAAVGGLLLATNMLEVWQAKYPTTEILAQLIFLSLLLCLVVSVRTGWRPAAGLAGMLLGIGWLERADMLLPVAVAVGVGAALVALRRWDSRCWWFAAGLGVTLPHALWQAYAGARAYTLGNGVPHLSVVVAGTVAAFALALLVRAFRRASERLPVVLGRRSWQFGLGFALCAVALVLLVVGFLRPALFGANYGYYGTRLVRTYNEQNLHRLSWFLTLPGFAVAGLGLALVALRPWRASLWLPIVPFLLIAPIYVYDSRNSSRLMWWGRRYIPEVVPGLILLIAVALGAALVWRGRRGRLLAIPALAVIGFLLVTYVDQSRPLRHHNEFAGSFQVSAEIAATAGTRTGVYLFEFPAAFRGCCATPEYLFGGAVWLERNQYAALLPTDPAADGAAVRRVVSGMPSNPVFVVWSGTSEPSQINGVSLVRVRHITAELPMWEESYIHRPSRPRTPVLIDFTVWHVVGT